MTHLTALWLPTGLSALACFVVSSIIHMASPWHKSDYPKLPDEEGVLNALRPFNIPPGDYMAPRPSSAADMKSPAFLERRNKGPILVMTVIPGGPVTMGKALGLWFAYLVVVNLISGWVAATALPPGAHHRAVFHYVGIVAFLGFAGGLWQLSIWYHRAWSITIKSTIDSLLYAAITAGIFAMLWPRA